MSRANVTLRNNYHIQCLWLHDPEHSWEGTSPDLIDLVLLTTVHSFRVRGRSQTELWVTEVSISVDIMQTFPNHLLLSEKALICYQQVQLGLRNTERAFIKTCSNLTARVSSIKLSTLPDRCCVLKCVHEDHGRVLSVGEVCPAVTEQLHFLQIKDRSFTASLIRQLRVT